MPAPLRCTDGTAIERTQISNFRFYQDRATGDIVVFSTRFGETSVEHWKRAHYYRYRIRLESS